MKSALLFAPVVAAQWWSGAPSCASSCLTSAFPESTWPAPASFCEAEATGAIMSCVESACESESTVVDRFNSGAAQLCDRWSSCSSAGSTGVYTIIATGSPFQKKAKRHEEGSEGHEHDLTTTTTATATVATPDHTHGPDGDHDHTHEGGAAGGGDHDHEHAAGGAPAPAPATTQAPPPSPQTPAQNPQPAPPTQAPAAPPAAPAGGAAGGWDGKTHTLTVTGCAWEGSPWMGGGPAGLGFAWAGLGGGRWGAGWANVKTSVSLATYVTTSPGKSTPHTTTASVTVEEGVSGSVTSRTTIGLAANEGITTTTTSGTSTTTAEVGTATTTAGAARVVAAGAALGAAMMAAALV